MTPLVRLALALTLIVLSSTIAHASPASTAEKLAEARALLDYWSVHHSDVLERARVLLDQVDSESPKTVASMRERARLVIMSGYLGDRTLSNGGHRYKVGRYRPGTLNSAETILREALALAPRFADGYVLLGHVLMEQDRVPEAADALRKAEELGTKDPWLHLNWAAVHMARGETAAAVERSKRVVALGTENEKARRYAYEFLIDHLRQQGRHEEAVALYRELLAKATNDAWGAWGHGNFAWYLQSLGRYEEAIVEARTALRIMDYGIGRRNLSVSLYSRWAELREQGKPGDAQPYFDEAQRIEPDLSRIMTQGAPHGHAQALVRVLVREEKVPVDARDTKGSTALLLAVNKNNREAVSLLLSMGADPNVTDRTGWAPLTSAADEGNGEIVGLLLAAGADRNVTRKGVTADVIAESKGHPALARQIREYRR